MWYVATLGYTPEVLLDLHDSQDIDGVVIVHGDRNKQQEQAIQKARVLLSMFNIDVAMVEAPRPWNFEECFQAIRDAHAEHVGDEAFIVNASGGTEVLNSAATLFAVVHGVEARYVDRDSKQVSRVDYGLLRRVLALDGTKRSIIDALSRRGGQGSIQEISQGLGVTKGAVSMALKTLETDGVVSLMPRDKGRGKDIGLDESLWPLLT